MTPCQEWLCASHNLEIGDAVKWDQAHPPCLDVKVEFSSFRHRSSHVSKDEVAVEKNGMFWIVFALNSKARCLVNVLLHTKLPRKKPVLH